MKENKVLDITDNVSWIGVTDPDLKTFDIVMETKFGTTYNSYFINAEKKTIIDTVKLKFFDEYLAKLNKFIRPEEIQYIVVNHTEPDHTGSLIKLLELAPDAVVLGSGNAIRYLSEILNKDFKNRVVRDGESIDLGNKTLKIIGAPNLHWPDSIYTWLVEDKVLFTCDSFGCHYCDERMFDDLVGDFDEAFRYYFDVILKPFSKFIIRAVEKIRPLDISVICPGHGPILRKNWQKYVLLSEELARDNCSYPKEQYVFIPYVSAYNYTAALAERIAEGIKMVDNIKVDLCNIEHSPIETLEDKLRQCTGLVVGSPTINQNTLLQIYQLFAMINPVRDRSKFAAVFGSYGWSGESAVIIETILKTLKFRIYEEKFLVKFNPSSADLNNAVEFGKNFAHSLLKNRIV
jgi:NADH oxidase (H2O-forming)